MDDEALVAELHDLGIDENNARIVALLPLVQVAWVDGVIDPREAAAILQIARERGWLPDDSIYVLDGWLAHAPSDEYFRRGRVVIRELARRDGSFDPAVTPDTVEAIIGLCERVAKSAGGVFGLVFTVSAEERAAIQDIAEALRIAATETGWDDLVSDLSQT